ncbi:hypothetical protein [Dyadobacter sp. CY326]|uniref:hypothetical protein n=1 Tax=Dyadobacter sp. CY326 TaxID=2907300 RepID=UPI001F3CF411|nr:hypothetical protein [Dyadobacter sp. CY326]MCE7068498.1 hypothetical protein [Dyadobacter sp. CY326]
MDSNLLPKMAAFLERVGEMNEDTAYSDDDQYLVDAIIALVNEQGHTSITADFNKPFIHPMITIQKWVEELKLIVQQKIDEKTS